jgi:hypothetical protein
MSIVFPALKYKTDESWVSVNIMKSEPQRLADHSSQAIRVVVDWFNQQYQ